MRPGKLTVGIGISLALMIVTTAVIPAAAEEGIHIVQTGDTLSRIARWYSSTVAAIVQVNQLADPDLILVGQRLAIPHSREESPRDLLADEQTVRPAGHSS